MARKKKAVAKVSSPEVPSEVEAPKPNLKFIGKVPVTKFKTETGAVITLPADQSECFYHEQAVLIAQRLPNYYQLCDGCNCGK
jgi:hypothetical protein